MKKQIAKLESRIERLSNLYYAGTPEVSDAEFDKLVDELEDLHPDSVVLKLIGAPPPEDSPLKKLKHTIPMGSLKKCNTEDECTTWANKTNSKVLVIQEKLDGLSVGLDYENGKLIHATTRGDGTWGESIIHNVRHMQNVKLDLPDFTGSLRGEIFMRLSDFEKHFKDEESNPRNLASGMARRKTTTKDISLLGILYFDCICADQVFETESEKIIFTESLGLKAVETRKVGIENAIKWYNFYNDGQRGKLDHEIDGMVLKVNNIKDQEALGISSGCPKGAIAWKFPSQAKPTTLESIEWTMGLTDRITPVAQLAPVHVAGVTIEKASLHNWSIIQDLGITHTKCTVLVARAGDVIPHIEEVIENKKLGDEITFPTNCPVCKHETKFDGEYLICPNKDCSAKKIGAIKKFIKVAEIDDAGDAFVTLAIDSGLLSDPADLFTLDVNSLSKLPRFGKRSAERVIKNIQAKKVLPLPLFFGALNISGVGRTTFKSLEKAGFDTTEKLLSASAKDFERVEGIAEKTANFLVDGLAEKKDLIEKLLFVGVSVGVKSEDKMSGKLNGLSFCFTGKLPSGMGRSIAQKMAADEGAEIKSAVSKGLTYLVQADPSSQSSKTVKAEKYGTKVISEEDFLEMIDFSPEKLLDPT